MNGIGKDPAFVLTLALGTFAVGGFLAISHLGRTSAPAQMNSSFASRFAPERAEAAPAVPASHLKNFKRGTEVIKARASAAASNFGFSFGGPAPAARTATASAARNESWRYTSSSSRGQYPPADGPRDWASTYYKGPKGMNAGGSKSWSASGGGVSKAGASASAPWTASGGESAEGDIPAGEEMPGVDRAAVASYARAQASAAAAGQAASAMYASVSPRAGDAGSPARPSAGTGNPLPPIPTGRTGSISGMRSGVSAAALGGMEEGMRPGSGGSYGAQMAGGAADVAAKVAAVPMPSADSAKAVTPSGGSGASGGSSSGSGSSSGTPPANTPKAAGNNDQPEAAPPMFAYAPGSDFFQDIASEKLNGREDLYLRAAPPQLKSMDGAEDAGLEALLKPRTVHPSPAPSLGDTMPQGVPKSAAAVQAPPDPERLEEVSGARREAIKAETHIFLHKLESRYGKTTDIQRVGCDSDRDTCRDHSLRGAYLTIVTATGAKLALGLRRVDREGHGDRGGRRGFRHSDPGTREPAKWRLYTIDFQDGEQGEQ